MAKKEKQKVVTKVKKAAPKAKPKAQPKAEPKPEIMAEQKVAPPAPTDVETEEVVAEAKTWSEISIREMMIQKGVDREKALEILKTHE